MRKYYLLLMITAICGFNFCYSQNVGIGTTNPLNKLHVAGGFRLDTLVGVNGNGLLRHDANGVVYGIKFTGNTADVLRGDGTFSSASVGPLGWFLNGNPGTNPTTNFLGTTDAQPLVFKVNNILSGQIHPSTFNTGFGLNAFSSITTGHDNAFFGKNAGMSNTTGNFNSFFGTGAGSSNTTADRNTFIGINTGLFSTTGHDNSFLGASAGSGNTTGSNNVFLGGGTGSQNQEGNFNLFAGSSAGASNNSASSNTFLGYQAGQFT
jgi:hypothetical protein